MAVTKLFKELGLAKDLATSYLSNGKQYMIGNSVTLFLRSTKAVIFVLC